MTRLTVNDQFTVWVCMNNLYFKLDADHDTTVQDILSYTSGIFPNSTFALSRLNGKSKTKLKPNYQVQPNTITSPYILEKYYRPQISNFTDQATVDDYLVTKLSLQAKMDYESFETDSLVRCKIIYAPEWKSIFEDQCFLDTAKTVCGEMQSLIISQVEKVKALDFLLFEANDLLSPTRLLERLVRNSRFAREPENVHLLNSVYCSFLKSDWKGKIDSIISDCIGLTKLGDRYPTLMFIEAEAVEKCSYTAYREIGHAQTNVLLKIANEMRNELIARADYQDEGKLGYVLGIVVVDQMQVLALSKFVGNFCLLFELGNFNMNSISDQFEASFLLLAISLFISECQHEIRQLRSLPLE